ncbi:MAG TPA: GntR family transcriptional regulator [Steroidobacteraceae bacterium]|jgi:GntR family transcriptional regulator|nr:GntR family transcriptional regulator [Steroidobacteraceae bacterium]
MLITIDERLPEPVFSQLVSQIREAVRSGQLKPGAPLPAIRQLAVDLQINPNTVAKAYRLLERDAVIETGPRGSLVHQDAKKHSRVDLGAHAVSALAQVIAALREKGLTDSEIRNSFVSVMRE